MVELAVVQPGTPVPPVHAERRLILITQGRYSGRAEAALLTYRRINNDYLIVASSEGNRAKPNWYLNLKEEPIVQVELGDLGFHAKAHTPTGTDRVRLLPFVRELLGDADHAIPRETAAILLSPMC